MAPTFSSLIAKRQIRLYRSIKYGKIFPYFIAADFVDLPAAVSFSD
jgi:hypothetical protein